jgi:hypothetical protein
VKNNSKQHVLVGQIRRQWTGRDKDWEGDRRLRDRDGKNLRQANKSRDEALGGRRGAGRQGGGREQGAKKRTKTKRRGCFLLVRKKQGGHTGSSIRQVENSGKTKKDTQKSSLSLVNKKGKRKKDDNNKRPKRRFKKLDIHIRGDAM